MSFANNPCQQYLNSAVLTADTGRLTLMLFTGALKFTLQAKEYVTAGNIPGAHKMNIRAQDILLHLLNTVNTNLEIGKNLAALYDYLYRRLVEANVKKDAAILEEVAGLLKDLAGTWEKALTIKNARVVGA